MITPEEIFPTAAHAGLIPDMDIAVKMGGSVDFVCDRTGYPMLHLAALSGNPNAIRWLYSKGVNLNATNDEGQGVVEIAINRGNNTVVDALIEIGAPIDHVWPNGDTVLHKIIRMDRSHMIRHVIEEGCNADERNLEGETAIDIASKSEFARCVRALASAGADIKTIDTSKTSVEIAKIIQAWKASQLIFA